MTQLLAGLQPAELWKNFEAVSAIPRGSGNEGAVRNFLISIAEKHGLPYKVDTKGNLVISKKGTEGYENAPSVVIQGHMDMVCEKNEDSSHDFTKDPIKLKIEGDYLKAEGTSLGADNGIGVAAGLSVMVSKDISHPPLEFLFTVEEETGLTGAKHLESDFLKGRIMLNLDSEEEGDFYIGCAGGLDGEIRIDVKRETVPKSYTPFTIKALGMKGGHSGLDIHKGRANAIKVVTRILWNVIKEIDLYIVEISGGSKRNAIAREAQVVIYVPDDKVNGLKEILSKWQGILRKEFGKTESHLAINLVQVTEGLREKAFTKKSAELVLDILYAMPHGVVNMNRDNPNFVETSTNLGIVATDKDTVILTLNHRSSSDSAILAVAEGIEALSMAGGVSYARGPGYPGWQPNMDSPVLKIARKTYKNIFNKEVNIKAIHAGLECGIIGEKFPGMDMMSFGPTMESVHSPDERFYIPSAKPFWKFLTGLLKNLR